MDLQRAMIPKKEVNEAQKIEKTKSEECGPDKCIPWNAYLGPASYCLILRKIFHLNAFIFLFRNFIY